MPPVTLRGGGGDSSNAALGMARRDSTAAVGEFAQPAASAAAKTVMSIRLTVMRPPMCDGG